ncbi:hypothetical protein [Micromonospora sp. SH-82]|uniref:hypothetical protein n=1 Tax=Micromonospora sp. SH-82 TaxID=3132938 RepID=UPI003EB99ED9
MRLIVGALVLGAVNLVAAVTLLLICIRTPGALRRVRHRLAGMRLRRPGYDTWLQVPPKPDPRAATLWRPDLYD